MAISKELFLSILAIDSYNRGYDEGIEDISETLGNTQLGQTSGIDPNDPERQASFFASSYTAGTGVTGLATGTKIISYRGTDDPVADSLSGY